MVKHLPEMQNEGFDNPIAYITHIVQNFSKIYSRADTGNINRFILCVEGKKGHSNDFMPIDLKLEKGPDGYYSIVSAFPKGKIKVEGILFFDDSTPSSPVTATDSLIRLADNKSDVSYHGVKAISNNPSAESVSQVEDEGKATSEKETLRHELYEKVKADIHPELKKYVDNMIDDFYNGKLRKASKNSTLRRDWEMADRTIRELQKRELGDAELSMLEENAKHLNIDWEHSLLDRLLHDQDDLRQALYEKFDLDKHPILKEYIDFNLKEANFKTKYLSLDNYVEELEKLLVNDFTEGELQLRERVYKWYFENWQGKPHTDMARYTFSRLNKLISLVHKKKFSEEEAAKVMDKIISGEEYEQIEKERESAARKAKSLIEKFVEETESEIQIRLIGATPFGIIDENDVITRAQFKITFTSTVNLEESPAIGESFSVRISNDFKNFKDAVACAKYLYQNMNFESLDVEDSMVGNYYELDSYGEREYGEQAKKSTCRN